MLFFRTKKEKEEIQDKIDDIDMAIYRGRCELEAALEKNDEEAEKMVRQKIEKLEKKRKKLRKKI